MKDKAFDVIIIGGGVAGISAALWCDELGLGSVLLESDAELGGQLLWTYNAIENHLGIKTANGNEMRDIFVRQIENRKFTLRFNSKVSEIDCENKIVSLENGEILSGQALVIATGVRRRTLGIEGERRFINRGIISSGKRDKDLVKGKRVLIIGGGDAALENTLILSETADKVYLAHRRDILRAREEFINQARQIKKIEFLPETILKKIEGDEQIESVTLEKNNQSYPLPVDAILFRIGVQPNIEFLNQQIELNPNGYIKINSLGETNLKGIFAVGDVANPVSPTISTAVGMGTTAIKAIYAWLK